MNKDEDYICFYRDAVIAGHDAPAAETMRRFNLTRDYTIRLLNEAIARCDGHDIRNWSRRKGVISVRRGAEQGCRRRLATLALYTASVRLIERRSPDQLGLASLHRSWLLGSRLARCSSLSSWRCCSR